MGTLLWLMRLTFTEPAEMLSIEKCIRQELPMAMSAVFKTVTFGVEDQLEFLRLEHDSPRPETDDGYFSPGGGDSGFGYMVTDKMKE